MDYRYSRKGSWRRGNVFLDHKSHGRSRSLSDAARSTQGDARSLRWKAVRWCYLIQPDAWLVSTLYMYSGHPFYTLGVTHDDPIPQSTPSMTLFQQVARDLFQTNIALGEHRDGAE